MMKVSTSELDPVVQLEPRPNKLGRCNDSVVCLIKLPMDLRQLAS